MQTELSERRYELSALISSGRQDSATESNYYLVSQAAEKIISVFDQHSTEQYL